MMPIRNRRPWWGLTGYILAHLASLNSTSQSVMGEGIASEKAITVASGTERVRLCRDRSGPVFVTEMRSGSGSHLERLIFV